MMAFDVPLHTAQPLAQQAMGYTHHAKPLWMYFAQLLGATGTAIACLCGMYVWIKRSPSHEVRVKTSLHHLVERFPWMRHPATASQRPMEVTLPLTPETSTPSVVAPPKIPEVQAFQPSSIPAAPHETQAPQSYPLDTHHTLHWLAPTQQWVITSSLHPPVILGHELPAQWVPSNRMPLDDTPSSVMPPRKEVITEHESFAMAGLPQSRLFPTVSSQATVTKPSFQQFRSPFQP